MNVALFLNRKYILIHRNTPSHEIVLIEKIIKFYYNKILVKSYTSITVEEFLGIQSITNNNWSFFNIILIKMKNNNYNIHVYLEIYLVIYLEN
jgi:hypothetical protein